MDSISNFLEYKNNFYKQILIDSGVNPTLTLDKEIPQSVLFMMDLIPEIHAQYLPLPSTATLTCLDVGPASLGGTKLLHDTHTQESFCRLKLLVSAVDVVDRYVTWQKAYCPNIDYFVQDITTIKDRHWDFVVASHVIEHVPNPIEFIQHLQSLAKDYVFISCPFNENPFTCKSHINCIDSDFLIKINAQNVKLKVNYSWGKDRYVVNFHVKGTFKEENAV